MRRVSNSQSSSLPNQHSSIRDTRMGTGFTFQSAGADNQKVVTDAETAVIGGLTVTQVTVVKTLIPFLVDLPIVGPLFGLTRRREQRRDLLILVKPHITDSPLVAR